ncbi:MAG: SDR family NAD(P)-dependent oxidoreductase [Verrucomicrobia bacterium]|nr:SDR family NAD(P)-dependent oxidoreductase [Verrucomicrobiota bacterium]
MSAAPSSAKPTALVTGANKGIGHEIARQLAQRGWRVFLGARDPQRGREAAAKLAQEAADGGSVEFLAIDVSEPASIARAAEDLQTRTDGGALDVLVNNAAILEDADQKQSILEIAPALLQKTLETNLFGALRLTQALAPALAKSGRGGRVINLSSGLGQLSEMDSAYPAYSISKTALNALTRQFAGALKSQKISVNTMCPGWVRTDMGGANATRTVEQGADTAVWLATEAPAELTGEFLRDRKQIPW